MDYVEKAQLFEWIDSIAESLAGIDASLKKLVEPKEEVVMVQNVTAGRCKSVLEPLKLGEGPMTGRVWCELRHGHKGAHKGLNGVEWMEPEIPKISAKRCWCEMPEFTPHNKPLEAFWRCIKCKGLLWMGNQPEPTDEIEWLE